MEKPKYQIIMFISGIFTILAFSNLLIHVHLTKYTEHLTYLWMISILTAQLLLVVYGLINKIYFMIIPASIIVLGVLYIYYTKRNYEINNEIVDDLIKKDILIKNNKQNNKQNTNIKY